MTNDPTQDLARKNTLQATMAVVAYATTILKNVYDVLKPFIEN